MAARRPLAIPGALETLATATPVQSASTVVHRTPHRYEPLTAARRSVPVVLVYSLINKPAILDIQPDRSVVRRLLEAGFDVYLLDWREPTRLDSSLRIDDYVCRFIDECVDVVRDRAAVESVTVFGYCMGGTLSAIYAVHEPRKVESLVPLAAGLDFTERAGILSHLGAEEHYDESAIPDAFGTVPAESLDAGFVMIEPVTNTVTRYAHLYDDLEDEAFVTLFARVEHWLRDGVDLAGAIQRVRRGPLPTQPVGPQQVGSLGERDAGRHRRYRHAPAPGRRDP
jgi:polyhydroxyalkanoate synthase